ncbi:rho GTPase-activating protein 15-like isoform X2 [Atheta coriaria]|uniref:rho GTPase-activating protein 15-like isoform X2 n=1 Tax=Dalotia coriaria TaxID=877792 RepID=UPI0031F35F23
MESSKKLTRSKTFINSLFRSKNKIKADNRRHSVSMQDVTIVTDDGTKVLKELKSSEKYQDLRKKSKELDFKDFKARSKARHTFNDFKVSSNYDNEIRSVDSQRKDSKREEMMLGQQSPGISWDTNSRDNKFDFHNVKKYKMDNQVIKLNKNEVIENQNGRLLHKNSEGIKTLTEDFEHCKIEQKSPKEHILILPDKKRINLYSKNSKEKLSPAPSPESVRAAPAKTDMRNRLMQLFKLRPARDTLLDRGILKNENVFGNTLQALHLKHNQAIPSLVLKCIEYVELPANIDTQGLYRSSASLATLQDIRFAINATHGTNLSSLEKYQTSPDVPSGLLKLFIRELKEPLISNEHFERMFEVCQSDDFNELKYEAIYRIIQTMLPSHKCTLDVLLKHLIKVISHQDKNDMTIEGISICWGQSMITGEEGSDPVLMARRKNEVVELLLRAYNAKDINDSESHSYSELSKEQATKDVDVNVDVNPIPKPSRIPQRQASVESYMKPKVSIDSNTNIKNNSIHGSKTSIGSNSSQPRNSGGLNFGPPGNYVQTVAAKLGNFQIQLSGRARMKSLTKSMESLNKMGSTMSLCDENKQCNRLKFIKTLISKIESTPDFKGVYRGKGKASIVEKLVRKYNKENSKEFGRYLAKADIFVFGQVLQEVTKEIGYVIDFYDMQSLVERKNKTEIKQILNEIPEEFILLFRHFDNLRKKADCKVTIMDDIFQSWWNILIGPPNEKDNLHKERVGRNLTTFEALVQNIIELCAIELKIKSASSFDLRDIDHDMTSVRSSLTRKHSCCNILENRMTSVYEYSKEYHN